MYADARSDGKDRAGDSYLIFGSASLSGTIDLTNLGAAGITIYGADAFDMSGHQNSRAGDVNGDGFDDLLIGTKGGDAQGNSRSQAGDSYVVFGAASLPGTIDLANLGAAGIAIYGADAFDYSGRFSNAGDVNGDGFDDLLIGAYYGDAAADAKTNAGDSYVIFGSANPPGTIDLAGLGAAGITIHGAEADDRSGVSVASAGDVNADGFDDVLIGVIWADALGNGSTDAGESYLIFGGASLPGTIDLASLGAAGMAIYGADADDRSGKVSNAGDVDGDGFDDLVIGAVWADAAGNAKSNAGESYVIFGSDFTSSVTHLGTDGADTLMGDATANVMVGGRGADTLVGGGGADVLRGGEGDDVLAVGNLGFSRIVGGNGVDTLRLDTGGLTLDLTALADNRILGVETIDITGSGANALTLDLREVLNISDESNTLLVRRDDDTFNIGPGWTLRGAERIGSGVYEVFAQGAATLKLQVVGLDFGDAPVPYPTTLAEDGGWHDPSGPTLGVNRDDEIDGAHSANSDADDTAGTADDEDGVSFGTLVAGQTASATIEVAGGTGRVTLFMDFDQNGDWTDAGERVFDADLDVGTHNITFAVPDTAAPGTTFARARIATNASEVALPTGSAGDGEVEDYAVSILPQVTVAVSPAGMNEGAAGTLDFTFTRTGDITNPLTIDFDIAGTADSATDYANSGADAFGSTGSTGAVTIPAGLASATVSIDPTTDTTVEADETVILTLTAAAAYDVGTLNSATGTIINDDTASLTIAGITQPEGTGGTTDFHFDVTLDNAVQGGFLLTFSVQDGTATEAHDFDVIPINPMLRFAGSAAEVQTIRAIVDADSDVEADEWFTVALRTVSMVAAGVDPGDISIADSPATGTILNDDTEGILVDVNEPNDTQPAAFPLGTLEGRLRRDHLTVHEAGNDDWYWFQTIAVGDQESAVSVTFDPVLGDLDLYVYRWDGGTLTPVGSSEGVGDEEWVGLYDQPAGNYYVQVVGFDGATHPHYSMQIDTPYELVVDEDEYEPNDTHASASPLRTIEGRLRVDGLTVHAAGNDDWYRFETSVAGRRENAVQIDFRHAFGDLELELLDASGRLIDGSYDVQNAERVGLAGLPAGVYYARVYGHNGAKSPNYTLTIDAPVSTIAADRLEVNDTQATATDFGVVEGKLTREQLTIHNANDLDLFRFELAAKGRQGNVVQIDFRHAFGDLDLELRDWDMRVLTGSYGVQDWERIDLDGLPAGIYYVQVDGAKGATSPDYMLTIDAPEAGIDPDHLEPNDARNRATDLKTVEGTVEIADLSIHAPGNDDWFRFQTAAGADMGHYVRIDFEHALGDLDVALYRGSDIVGASPSVADFEQIGLDGLPKGEYFLRVYGYSDAVNPQYTVTIEAPVAVPLVPDYLESNDEQAMATVLRSNADADYLAGWQKLHDLSIHDANDVDYFSFTTVATGTAAHGASLRFPHGDGDLAFELLDENEAVLSQANGQQDAEYISLAGLGAGTYLLRVYGTAGATNRYELSIDTPAMADGGQNLDDWTILVYITASDLAQFAFDDVNEMEIAASHLPGSVNLAVLWDQSSTFETYETGGGSQPAWGTAGRAIIVGDTNPAMVATPFEILGERNTGDPATLQESIGWATDAAPARNYGLILWDHGGGLTGFNVDDSDGDEVVDALSTSELVTALEGAAVSNLRLVSFDSCLMAVAEVGYNLRQWTDVVVASQEVVGGDGHDYTTLFETLYMNPAAVDAEELATGFVRSYEWQYGGTGGKSDTHSAMRTSGYDDLAAAIRAFVAATESPSEAELVELRRARNASVGYAIPYLRDLGGFMRVIEENPHMSDGIRGAAAGVREAIQAMLVARSSDTRNSSGASIFLPSDGSHVDSYANMYASFDAASGWSAFLERLGDCGPDEYGGRDGRFFNHEDWSESREDVPAYAAELGVLGGHGHSSSPGLKIGHAADADWFRFGINETGTANDRVVVTPLWDDREMTVQLYDRTGTTVLDKTTGVGEQGVPLLDRAAGEYLVRVSASSTLVPYTLAVDAPGAPTATDWAGDNSTPDKASPLGLVDNQKAVSGLAVPEDGEDWLNIATPRLSEPSPYSLTVSVGEGSSVTAELYDAGGNVVSSASGSGELDLPYTASGSAESYTVHIVGDETPSTSEGANYNLAFQASYGHWHNASNQYDVTGEGLVTAYDVLRLINYINAHPDGSLPAPGMEATRSYFDVNKDNKCTAYDVLLLVNEINRQSGGQPGSGGEGESRTVTTHSEADREMEVLVSSENPAFWAPVDSGRLTSGYLSVVVPTTENVTAVPYYRHEQDARGRGRVKEDGAATTARRTTVRVVHDNESTEDDWEDVLSILAEEIAGVVPAGKAVDSLFANDADAFGIG